MTFCCIVSITVTLSIVAYAASLECFNCTGVTNTDACQNKLACGENEVCFTQRQYSGQISYDLGCIESQKCGDFANLPSGISRMDTYQGQTHPCFECCSRDGCNINLCQYKDPALCVDDERVDCAFYNSLFNFCKDINQAKKVCPKYCKLCQVVDGNWTPWSNWSNCDVTCENGTQIRTRSCTDPAPQYGGLDCWGNNTESNSCHRVACPIHGGWNTWSTWSECSVSCDIGMQHRDRLCTNPSPSLFGDHCFGSAEQYRICMPGACADGGWSAWGSWGTCSQSCDGGLMSRNRACSNPAPSISGKQCEGNSENVSLCNTQACQASQTYKDDVWSAWGSWGACSDTCAGGIMSRNRTCSDQAQSMTGIHCVGNSEQVGLCNKQSCPEDNVAFTAYHLYRSSSTTSYDTIRFQDTYINYGSGYATTTGNFTCTVPGLYHFVVSLLKATNTNYVSANLRINGNEKLQLFLNPSNDIGQYMMTGAGTFHLDKNDVVDVNGIPNNFDSSYNSYFTGFLIRLDQ